MRKLITILFVCLLAYSSKAQTNHYMATYGSDSFGDGTFGNPWASLSHSCSLVSTANDTIHVIAGTYTETHECVLAVGVNIKGEGISSHIIIHYVADFNENDEFHSGITLASTTQGTDGHQSITNLLLDGDNLTATTAVLIRCRSNVLLKNLIIKDFYVNGVCLIGGANPYTLPTTYATGNEISFCTISNCTDSSSTFVGGGLINMSGQKNFSVHDCNLPDTSRSATHNGDIVVGGYYGIGFKFYNNISYKPRPAANDWWNFHLELPNEMAGVQIYNNKMYGGDTHLDLGLNHGYDYSYDTAFSVHDNYFYDYSPTVGGTHGKYSIIIEGPDVKNIYIFRNTMENVIHALAVSDGTGGNAAKDSNIHFFENISINTGEFDNNYYGNLIEIEKLFTGSSINGLYIINNTIIPNSLANTSAISIVNNNGCTMNNVVIANNILINSKNQYWMWVDNTGSTISNLTVKNNILYNNPNSNTVNFIGNAVTGYTNTGNINSNPLLVSSTDYHLQASSPAIGAAYNYGFGSDIGGLQYSTIAAPTVSMSGSQSITTTSTSIYAVPSWASGHSGTVAWTKISGPGTTTFSSTTTSSTTVSGLQNGDYVFQCTLLQDDGQTVTGTVSIHVAIPSTQVPFILFRFPRALSNQ